MVEDKPSRQGKNKAFIENQWKPGESGNPGGRPKDKGITSVQIDMLDKPCPYAKSPDITWRQWLAEKGLILAAEKEAALEHLKERLEGKVLDEHKIVGDVPVSIVYKLKGEKDV